LSRTTLLEPTSIRLQATALQRIRTLAEREGNGESAVIRRALAAGLDVIDPQEAGNDDHSPELVARISQDLSTAGTSPVAGEGA
jgi:hypothetical protein